MKDDKADKNKKDEDEAGKKKPRMRRPTISNSLEASAAPLKMEAFAQMMKVILRDFLIMEQGSSRDTN